MKNQQDLTNKKCVPCEGGTPPLTLAQISEYQQQLVAPWEVIDSKKITKDFKFKNFKQAVAFINQVAEIAELEGHHPDILLHGYNKVRLDLWTHAIGGLSENDFIIAAKVDKLN